MSKALDLVLDEGTKEQLLAAVKRFKQTRQEALWPVFDELAGSLERGATLDAYMARYLRDTLTLGEKGNDSFKPVLEKLDAIF